MSERNNGSDDGDSECTVAVVDGAREDGNNSSSSSKKTDHDDDDHLAYHSGLLTIGEKCIHLICEFIRTFDTKEVLFGAMVADGAVSLSRLSRTCRLLYIYVRNLPSVLEFAVPPFSTHLLPWGTIGLELGYWCDIAGLVWEVRDPRQLLLLTSPRELSEKTSDQDNKQSDVRLGNLFLNLHSLSGVGTLSRAERAEFVRILEQCGGLSFSLYGSFDPIASVGLDLRRCKNLRYLYASVSSDSDLSYKSYEVLLIQLADMEEKPQFASIAINNSRAGIFSDLNTLRGFHFLRSTSSTDESNLTSVRHARFAKMKSLSLPHIDTFVDSSDGLGLSSLKGTHTFVLRNCEAITDVGLLGCMHTLELNNCPFVADVRMLGDMHKLCMIDCDRITDISALGSVRELYVRNCGGSTGVGGLANHASTISGVNKCRVLSLDLGYRDVEADVSMFGGVHTLKLLRSRSITDVSALGNIHTLELFDCRGVTDVSMLGNVHTLTLTRFASLTDVSMLGTVHTLSLSWCESLRDVSGLGKVHRLHLRQCNLLTDVRALASVHSLSLDACRAITHVRPLSTVHTLTLARCAITDVSALGSVHTLCFEACANITNVSTLGSVHSLSLAWCSGIRDVRALGSVHALRLGYCHGVTDVRAVGNVHTLALMSCDGVTDVSGLAGVMRLHLYLCTSVTNASTLINKVPFLVFNN